MTRLVPRSLAVLAVLAVALGLAAMPRALSAQVVQVHLTDELGQPLAPAVVAVLDSAGTERTRVTSPVSGRVLLALPPGRFRLRVARIGHRPWISDGFEVGGASSPVLTFELPAQPVTLATLEVQASERWCDTHTPPDATSAALLAQALTGLEIVSGSLRLDPPRLRMVHWDADLDPELRTTALRQWREDAVAMWPFESASLEQLRAHGFVDRPDAGWYAGLTYYAPDPRAVGSAWFLSANCFWLAPPDTTNPDQLGVAFRSVTGPGGSDLEGTFWIARATFALHRLDFRFVGPDPFDPRRQAGGVVHFARAGDGRYLPVAWRLRATVPLVGPAGTRPGVAAYRERGGFVTTVSTDSTVILTIPPGSLVAVPAPPIPGKAR
jgi:hypothetical protein